MVRIQHNPEKKWRRNIIILVQERETLENHPKYRIYMKYVQKIYKNLQEAKTDLGTDLKIYKILDQDLQRRILKKINQCVQDLFELELRLKDPEWVFCSSFEQDRRLRKHFLNLKLKISRDIQTLKGQALGFEEDPQQKESTNKDKLYFYGMTVNTPPETEIISIGDSITDDI